MTATQPQNQLPTDSQAKRNSRTNIFTRIGAVTRTHGPLKVPQAALSGARWFLFKRLLNRRCMCRNVQGRKMYLDLQHEGISRTLAIWGIREADHTLLFHRLLEPGMVVADIGANIGYYTLMAADGVGPDGLVYAIEPDPRNCELLTRNIQANGFSDRVRMHCGAVSNKTGVSKFYLADATNLNTTFEPREHDMQDYVTVSKVIDVEATTLDDFLRGKRPVNLIRMDIEGFEVEAFEGMLGTLETSAGPCSLIFETHPYAYDEGHNLRTILPEIVKLGFKVDTLVSAGRARPPQFEQLGYEPAEIVNDGQYTRGFYKDVRLEDAVELIHARPKCVRYVLLRK